MIVGLSGKAGSGKDTFAFALQSMFGFRKGAFADNLKASVSAVFGWPLELMNDPKGKNEVDPRWGISPRRALQLAGVAYRDTFGVGVWVQSLFETKIRAYPIADWVISDVRFVNEADAIRAEGGIVLRIERPGAGLTGEAALHVSETALDGYPFDGIVHNASDVSRLEDHACEAFVRFLDPDRDRNVQLVFADKPRAA